MNDIGGWVFLVLAAASIVNVYRHTSSERPATTWGGASAVGQACIGCGCLAMAAAFAVPKEHGSGLVWGVCVVGVTALWLGLRLEKRALHEDAQQAVASDRR